ncbi:MAG: response regulator [Thermoflexales bacterium]|nr:response regulator [Thermoflexales bacterium]
MAEQIRLLVVEDERDTADMLAAYFEAQGFEVMAAAWGQDAVQIAREKQPDLVLLDIRLPDIDGFEVCRQLRSHRRTESIPIIFLTEKRERIDKLAGLDLGAVDYITKPFDIQELRLRVRNVMRRASLVTLTDPITNLPTEEIVGERFTDLLQKRSWAVVCVGVHGLEQFSDVYGFVARDDVLRALALMLNNTTREVSDSSETFVGQLSNSVFVIIVEPARGAELRDLLSTRLKQAVQYFYPLKDERRALAPIRLALGLVNEQNGPYADSDALKEVTLNALRPV